MSREKAKEPDSSLGYRKSQELSKSSQLSTVEFKSKAVRWLLAAVTLCSSAAWEWLGSTDPSEGL